MLYGFIFFSFYLMIKNGCLITKMVYLNEKEHIFMQF